MEKLSNRVILVLLFLMFIVFGVVSLIFELDPSITRFSLWLSNFFSNLSTGMLSSIITFLLLQLLFELRQQRFRLLQELQSNVRDVAQRACEDIKARGWFHDGSLQGKRLNGAYLANANLNQARLEKTDLSGANLKNTSFVNARLDGVSLWDADLTGCNLRGANISGAHLLNTSFDETTILPNGEKWTPKVDLKRFTDRHHTEYFDPRSSEVYSSEEQAFIARPSSPIDRYHEHKEGNRGSRVER